MPSEAGSSTHNCPDPICAETICAETTSHKMQELNRPLRGRGGPPWNRNACNNVENPDVNQWADQLFVTIAQIATIITQINGVHDPFDVEKLGVQILEVVIPWLNEWPVGSNINGAPLSSHHTRKTQNDSHHPKGSHTRTHVSRRTQASSHHGENDGPCDVNKNSKHYPHRGNQRDLCIDLNTRLCQRDMRDRLNDCWAKHN